jgi:glucose-6-phosphate isomerase
LWNWVGSRYSLWSATGLPIASAVGFERFEELLAGAYEMHERLRYAPLEQNLPATAELIGIWHRDFLGHPTRAVLPFAQDLMHFPAVLRQFDMESNGK